MAKLIMIMTADPTVSTHRGWVDILSFEQCLEYVELVTTKQNQCCRIQESTSISRLRDIGV